MWQCLPKDQIFSLMDSFSIIEASALIAGRAPSDVVPEYDFNGNPCSEPCILSNANDEQRIVFDLALKSIVGAVEAGRLKAIIKTNSIMQLYKTDHDAEWQAKYTLSPNETRIERNELLRWLNSRQCYPDFFFNHKNTPLYLVQDDNRQYAPKLCAIVHAWEATKEAEDADALDGQSIKQFAISWLKIHAKQYGVDSTDFETMAQIMNWGTMGGRPSRDKPTLSNSEPTPKLKNQFINNDMPSENSEVISELHINKNDLEERSMHKYRKALDDDLPF